MSQSISLDSSTIKQVVNKLQQLESLKSDLLASIPEHAFKYGSKLWWDKVEMMANIDIKRGNKRQFKSIKPLINDLHK